MTRAKKMLVTAAIAVAAVGGSSASAFANAHITDTPDNAHITVAPDNVHITGTPVTTDNIHAT